MGKLMIQVQEQIKVLTNQVGEPVRFSWRNGTYLVTSKPERYFSRRPWWQEAARAQRGIGSSVLEVEIWRLSAAKGTCSPAQFELVYNHQKSSWQLVRICG